MSLIERKVNEQLLKEENSGQRAGQNVSKNNSQIDLSKLFNPPDTKGVKYFCSIVLISL